MPLPKGWIRTFSNSQKRYYYSHRDTKHTQWHFPTASEAADPWMAKRRAEDAQQREHSKHGGSSGSNSRSSNNNQHPSKRKPTTTSSKLDHQGNSGGSNKRPRTSTGNDVSDSKPKNDGVDNDQNDNNNKNDDELFLSLADATDVAIIVPYRDIHVEQNRARHLSKFVPHMIEFLSKLKHAKKINDYHIYIIEQSDDRRKFNRGKLLNIGFDLARKKKSSTSSSSTSTSSSSSKQHDVFIFHDVDLLPQDDLLYAYSLFPKTPYHIARVWDRYSNNPKYFGGVVSFSSSDFKRINGYPNTFWGWGGEDDELQLRCQAIGLKWDWPRASDGISAGAGTLIDLEEMDLKEKLNFLRQHKEWKCMVKWEALEEHEATWKTNGLYDLSYKVLETTNLDIKTGKATKITVDVKLNGTHWANEKCSVDFLGDWNNNNKGNNNNKNKKGNNNNNRGNHYHNNRHTNNKNYKK